MLRNFTIWSASEPKSWLFKAMQSNRFVLTVGSIALLLIAVGISIYLGFLNNQGSLGSNASAAMPAAFDLTGGRLVIDLTDADGSAFGITAKFESDDDSNDATLIQPNVSMTMIGHNMGRTLVPMLRRSDGTWTGSGSFPMSGRWRFQIVFDGEVVQLDHSAP